MHREYHKRVKGGRASRNKNAKADPAKTAFIKSSEFERPNFDTTAVLKTEMDAHHPHFKVRKVIKRIKASFSDIAPIPITKPTNELTFMNEQ